MMPTSSYPSVGAQAEFLTYLVVSQLIKRHLTGMWLTVEHVVESTHLWMHVSGHGFDLLQRVSLACRAKNLAVHVANIRGETFNAENLGGAFLDHLNLNYRSPVVAEIFSDCVASIVFDRPSIWRPPLPDRR